MRGTLFTLSLVAVLTVFGGCKKETKQPAAKDQAKPEAKDKGHGHSHEGDDVLFWQRENLAHEGFEISLGHHGTQVLAGHDLEPAVAVVREGMDIADAKVFVTLLDGDGKEVLSKEVPTVFEPKTDEEPAHYAQGELKVPEKISQATIRYRIVLPSGEEYQQDVAVPVKTH